VRTEHVDILLPDYLRGALESAIAAGVEAHLESCPACRAELESLRETFAALDQTRKEEIPGAYFSSILPRVYQRLERREKLPWISTPVVSKFLLPLGVVVVLLVVVWHLPVVWESTGGENILKTALSSASTDDIVEILQEDITLPYVSSMDTTILTRALADEQFVHRQLISEALNSETTSPFEVFADVSPQQVLNDLQESDAERVLQRLEKMEIP
jgi:predicted anti-sigma-YlaC factor YlaD